MSFQKWLRGIRWLATPGSPSTNPRCLSFPGRVACCESNTEPVLSPIRASRAARANRRLSHFRVRERSPGPFGPAIKVVCSVSSLSVRSVSDVPAGRRMSRSHYNDKRDRLRIFFCEAPGETILICQIAPATPKKKNMKAAEIGKARASKNPKVTAPEVIAATTA